MTLVTLDLGPHARTQTIVRIHSWHSVSECELSYKQLSRERRSWYRIHTRYLLRAEIKLGPWFSEIFCSGLALRR